MTNEHLILIANECISRGINFTYENNTISIDLKYYRDLCHSQNCGMYHLLYDFCLTNGFDLFNSNDVFYKFIYSK